MRRLFYGLFRNRWVRTLLGALLLCVILWCFGPLLGIGALHPLESELARIIAIAAILVGWLVENLIHLLRARDQDKKLAEGVAGAGADAAAAASAEEVALLGDRLKQALAALKRARIGGSGRRYLYQLPWYMFIGPPGAGKTTALINCGLNFPLAETHGPQAVRGVGGTRNCDWWFTDQAVLIDTAGRYTTQDSDAGADGAAWLGFLRLLKTHRGRQPLNGVLVAISLADLASLDDGERQAHAKTIRKRLRELHDQLGVHVPVYVIFTKADLIAGFIEFFDALTKEEREQVWGATFALDDGRSEPGAVAAFAAEFDALLGRLNDRLTERLQQETDLRRRRLIYGFPQQLAALRDVAAEFLTESFRPSRLEPRALLRGVYLTSGTQDGTPIDRLLSGMAGQFGLPRQAVTAFSGAGRSYFLARLMRDVIFGESGLVGLDPRVERRARLRHYATLAAAAIVILGLTGAWTVSWLGNTAMIGEVHGSAQRYEAQLQALRQRGPQDADLPATLPPLDTLRNMRGGYAQRRHEAPLLLTFGLYQGEKLSAGAVDAYRRALNAILLPRLLYRLEVQIQAHMDQPDVLYEALKVYLILGRQGPMDAALVTDWVGADIAASFPGDDQAQTRDALDSHLDALLRAPLRPIPLNGPLVAQARDVLTREPAADYIYNRLLRSAVVQGLPAWTVADNAGPAGGRVFRFRNGQPLNTGVPGIFTWDGYHSVFLGLLPEATQAAAEEEWVLGEKKSAGVLGSVADMNKLRHDVLSLYLDDYTRRWDTLLANIALKPFGTLAAAQDELYSLSAPDSPLRDLLLAIDAQTQLSRAAPSDKAASQAEANAAKVGTRLGGFGAYIARQGMTFEQGEIASVLAGAFGSDATGKPVDPATRVDLHFAGLHAFVAGGKDQPAQMETVIGKLQQIYQGINAAAGAPDPGAALLAAAGAGGGAGGGGSPTQQLAEVAKDAPKPIAEMLQTVSASSDTVTSSGASTELADAWRSKIVPLCEQAFDRYPFVASNRLDVPIDDFTRLLGPGGLIDQFFDQYLKPFVDTTTPTWHWQSGGGTKLGLSSGALAELQRASDIRDALFPTGGQRPSASFDVTPAELTGGLAQVSLEIGGARLSYANGPQEPEPMQWPGPNGTTQVRVTLTPASGGAGTVIEENGPWALLRLIDAARVTPTGQPDRLRVTFTGAGGSATFDVLAHSTRNPFTLTALRAFRCPERL